MRAEVKDLTGDLERHSAALLGKLRLVMDPEKLTEKFCRMAMEALKESNNPDSPGWQDVISAMAGLEPGPHRSGAKDFLTGLLNHEDSGAKKTAEPNIALELGKLIETIQKPEEKIPFCDFVEMPICRLVLAKQLCFDVNGDGILL